MAPPEAQNTAIPIQSVPKPEESLWRTAWAKAIFLSVYWFSCFILIVSSIQLMIYINILM